MAAYMVILFLPTIYGDLLASLITSKLTYFSIKYFLKKDLISY